MRKSMKKRASGGKLYNAHGTPAAAAAMDEKSDGFKKGGHVKKRKDGGMVDGDKDMGRMDKRRHGGMVKKRASGGSPYSSAHSTSGASKSMGGHEGEKGPDVD